MGADQSAFDHAVEAEKLKDFDKAVTLYQSALALNPKMVSAHNNIGIIYKNQGKVCHTHTHTQIDDARKHYKLAIAGKPSYSTAHYNLALLLMEHYRDYEQADKHLTIAATININDPEVHVGYGRLYDSQGKTPMV